MADRPEDPVAAGARADLWFAPVLVALGLAVALESWRMPRLENLGVDPLTAPGLVPGLIGVVLVAFGSILGFRAWRLRARAPVSALGWQAGEARRFVLALALCAGYALGLVGRTPFWLATTLFVFAFIAVFEWRNGVAARDRLIGLGTAALLAIVISALVTLVFERIFLVRLP